MLLLNECSLEFTVHIVEAFIAHYWPLLKYVYTMTKTCTLSKFILVSPTTVNRLIFSHGGQLMEWSHSSHAFMILMWTYFNKWMKRYILDDKFHLQILLAPSNKFYMFAPSKPWLIIFLFYFAFVHLETWFSLDEFFWEYFFTVESVLQQFRPNEQQ